VIYSNKLAIVVEVVVIQAIVVVVANPDKPASSQSILVSHYHFIAVVVEFYDRVLFCLDELACRSTKQCVA